jgi:polyhydroxyalkanoate synthesis regulator phasin
MDNFFETLIKLSLGTAALTREKAKKLVDEIARRGELSKEDTRKLFNDLIKKGTRGEKELRREVGRRIEKIMKRFDIPSRREINELKAEIAALKKAKARLRRARKNP